MSRKNKSLLSKQADFRYNRRAILPDAKYSSTLVTRFINRLMLSGNKSIVQGFVYEALEQLSKSEHAKGMNAAAILEKVINTVKPDVIVRTKRFGGSNYQIPFMMNINNYRRQSAISIALQWLVEAIRSKKAVSLSRAIVMEFEDALQEKGAAYNKKISISKTAESNKAFAHLAKSFNEPETPAAEKKV